MHADDHRPFAELLRRYRSAAGVTQEELAERAGITAKAVGALERGERRQPWPDTVRRLATALGLSEDARAAFLAAVSRHPAAASPPTPQWSLPAPLTPLVGRRREVADVRRLLAEARLVTLSGVGGTGKTRLALEAARQSREAFPGGTRFVDLAPVADPRLVPPTIEHALGAQQHPGATPAERMVRLLGERRVLLVLDNFEHVLEAAPVVTRLLSGAPELRVLATSRVLLHLSGEHEYRVPPLSLPWAAGPVEQSEAVRLFVQAARAARPDFVLTEANQPAVAAICARLDGLPLAIELAAARIRLFAPEALLAQLANRLEALTGRRRDLPARQQTSRGTFDWSYALLAPAERGLLGVLGVFAGGFTARAVNSASGCWRRYGSTRWRAWRRAARSPRRGDGTPRTTWPWPRRPSRRSKGRSSLPSWRDSRRTIPTSARPWSGCWGATGRTTPCDWGVPCGPTGSCAASTTRRTRARRRCWPIRTRLGAPPRAPRL